MAPVSIIVSGFALVATVCFAADEMRESQQTGVSEMMLAKDDACSASGHEDCSTFALQRLPGKANDATFSGESFEHRKFSVLSTLKGNLSLGAQLPLSEVGYQELLERDTNAEMALFIRRALDKIGGTYSDEGAFEEFVHRWSGILQFVDDPLEFVTGSSGTRTPRTYHSMLKELRRIAKKGSWVKLAPPAPSTVLWRMIRPDNWVCHLIPRGDRRGDVCNIDAMDARFIPNRIDCQPACSNDHANSYRTLFQIGSLPCCPYGYFCAAPACSMQAHSNTLRAGQAPTCTPRQPHENVKYMKLSDVWPAYHGSGGSFELDTMKYLDFLGDCKETSTDQCPITPVDLVLDLGSNVGYVTEKLTVRNFAKNYILIEANGATLNSARNRWGNEVWKKQWFAEQVQSKDGLPTPSFELINAALSNKTGGKVNMCATEASMIHNPAGCAVPVVTTDDLLEQRLTPKFKKTFKDAKSAFIKVDTEGMDELVFRGMSKLLEEVRGTYANGKPRHLVNFIQFEFCPRLMETVREREGLSNYNLKTFAKVLEEQGFEAFLIGPRFLPLTHGGWHDEYLKATSDPENNAGILTNYPTFDSPMCPWCGDAEGPTFVSDLFAIRSTYPRIAEMKRALGACAESDDFDIRDPQYTF